MGSVCSSGFKDDDHNHDDKKLSSTVVDVDDDKSRGFSGKLKSMRRRKPSDPYYSDHNGSSRRKTSKPNNENHVSFSGELGPVPPLRSDSTKVYFILFYFMFVNV